MLKNVEYKNKNFTILYGDKYEYSNFNGFKSYLALQYMKNADNGLVTCGSRNSIQVLKFSQVASVLNVPIDVFIPSGKDTEMIVELQKTKANIHRVNYGYSSLLNKRARDFAKDNNKKYVALGMLENFAFQNICNVFTDMQKFCQYNKYNNIVIPIGSGTSFLGFCLFAQSINLKNKIIGVECGMNTTKTMTKYSDLTQGLNIEIKKALVPYDTYIKNDLHLNETYEAKTLDFISDGDLLITVDY